VLSYINNLNIPFGDIYITRIDKNRSKTDHIPIFHPNLFYLPLENITYPILKMTWHISIIYSMEHAITQGNSFDFHGPYNSIIFQLFDTAGYCNNPHFLQTGVNEPFWYEVQAGNQYRPVFFLEIRAPSALDSIAQREQADLQTRERMVKLVGRWVCS
jgi:hypothetical protein